MEALQQLVQSQGARVVHVPRGIVPKLDLRAPRELARHHLGVDRIGQTHRKVACDQAQVLHVLDVVDHRFPAVAAHKKRLDHSADSLLLKLVRQLVQMRVAPKDERLSGFQNVGFGYRVGAVPALVASEARLEGQCIDQPRLTERLAPDGVDGVFAERLARFFRVLLQQRGNVLGRESRPRAGIRT